MRSRSPARPSPVRVVTLDGRSHPVDVRRHPAARRYTLRVAPDDRLRLTVPRWASIAEGLRFVESQADWIRRERARQAAARAPWGAGTRLWFRGALITIDPVPGGVSFGTPPLVVLTTATDIRPSVQARLRALAERELPPRLIELAAIRGLDVAAVHVRNQRSRWGACSSLRRITLNWRLIQMPPYVSDYVMLHELTHLAHPNHSPRFWRAVARVCPAWGDAEAWLRRWGRDLL